MSSSDSSVPGTVQPGSPVSSNRRRSTTHGHSAKPKGMRSRVPGPITCFKPGAPRPAAVAPLAVSPAVGSRSSFPPGQASLGPVSKVPSGGGARHPLGPSPRTPAQLARVSRLPERPRPPARLPTVGSFRQSPSNASPPALPVVSPYGHTHAARHSHIQSLLPAGSLGEGLPRLHPGRSGEPATSV